jgi:hypothetical protein
MSDPAGRTPRWTAATGDNAGRQVHALEFIASSLDRIDGHLETIAASIGGSGPHKPFGDVISEQLRALGDAIARMGRRS